MVDGAEGGGGCKLRVRLPPRTLRTYIYGLMKRHRVVLHDKLYTEIKEWRWR